MNICAFHISVVSSCQQSTWWGVGGRPMWGSCPSASVAIAALLQRQTQGHAGFPGELLVWSSSTTDAAHCGAFSQGVCRSRPNFFLSLCCVWTNTPNADTHTHTPTNTRAHTHTQKCTRTRSLSHTHINTHTHTHTHTHTRVSTHACYNTHIHTHTHIDTHITHEREAISRLCAAVRSCSAHGSLLLSQSEDAISLHCMCVCGCLYKDT